VSAILPPSRARARLVLAILFVVYVFNFIDRQILSILIGPIQDELGVSDTAMGLLSGFTFAIFYTLAGIPIARLSDRGSRRGVIAVSLGLWSLMTAATGLAHTFWSYSEVAEVYTLHTSLMLGAILLDMALAAIF